MEFDDLKSVWQKCDQRLNTSLHLNTRLLRSSILGNPDAALNRMLRCEIDFSAPVILVQKRLELLDTGRKRAGKWMLRLASVGEEMVEKLQASLVRVLRRRRVLRG